MILLVISLTLAIAFAYCAFIAVILMWLLGILAALTAWHVGIGFLPCLVIVVIAGLFA